MTTVPVPHLHNLRGLGGTLASGGQRIKTGLIFRSAAPLRKDYGIVDGVQDLGIRRIVDLRDTKERQMTPYLWDSAELEVNHVPVFDDTLDSIRFSSLAALYEIMLEKHGQALASAVGVLAEDPSTPALIHCTAGKDRTGVVVALLLETLGVDREHILTDFTRSEKLLGEDYLEDLFRGVDLQSLPGGAAHRAVSSPRGLLAGALAVVDSRHGSAKGYLIDHGLEKGAIDRLKNALFEK